MLREFIKYIVKVFLGGSTAVKKFMHANASMEYKQREHLNLFLNSKIDYEFSGLIKHIFRKGDVVFDIGANIGQFTLQFSNWVAKEGRVFSFEPDPVAASQLRANILMNKLENCELVQMAVSVDNNELNIYIDSLTGGRRNSAIMSKVGNSTGKFEVVNCISLNSCFLKYGIPDIIKIDVEGYEAEIFESVTHFHTKTIYLIEIVPESFKEIFQKFANDGFLVFRIKAHKKGLLAQIYASSLIPLNEEYVGKNLELENYLFIHPEQKDRLKDIPY